jgi:Flp pilus assembly pilin Flp
MPIVRPSAAVAAPCSPLAQLARDQRGAATVEYIIIAGMIAIACILGFKGFGDAVLGKVKAQTTAIGQVVEAPAP